MEPLTHSLLVSLLIPIIIAAIKVAIDSNMRSSGSVISVRHKMSTGFIALCMNALSAYLMHIEYGLSFWCTLGYMHFLYWLIVDVGMNASGKKSIFYTSNNGLNDAKNGFDGFTDKMVHWIKPPYDGIALRLVQLAGVIVFFMLA